MKLRYTIILIASTIFLTACNFTLAADVTPPPNYLPPTAVPTLGPLFPESNPDIANGKNIYQEKCLPCHGETGMGDGPQSVDLPVSVAALGLPETANKAAPATWYRIVTQGNLERFMPPFASLTNQERWDVISYALTLQTTTEQLEIGRNLFENNCDANCANKFSDLKTLSALSQDDIVTMIQNEFGSNFTDEEADSVAAYIRRLTFATPPPTGTLQPTPTTAPVTEATVSAESTPVDGTQAEVTLEAGFGNIQGSIDNQTGAELPSDLKIKLRAFEHSVSDPTASPLEITSVEGSVDADGSYIFENIEFPENRIYLAEVEFNGVRHPSEYSVVEAGTTTLELAPITIYAVTEDYSVLQIDDLQFYFDYANEDNVQILAVYSITNLSNQTVIIRKNESQEIPFIKMPAGVANVGYETSQDSAPFLSMDDAFAMPPTKDTAYGIIALGTVSKESAINIEQNVLLNVTNVMLLVPAGVSVEGETFSDSSAHDFEGGTFNMYTSESMNAGDTLSFTLSGEPSNTAVNPDITQNQTLLISIGVLGIALIIAGAWLYWRDKQSEKFNDDEEEDDTESVLDAIVAIDDLHRAGKLSDDAYKKRRAELKSKIKK